LPQIILQNISTNTLESTQVTVYRYK